jgi:REP element-mobilizing transposase RayT
MTHDPVSQRRHRSLRLPCYDYSQAGMYFVTACTHERVCAFGDVVNGEMRPNKTGEIVRTVWEALPAHYPHVALDIFAVMPNHVHGIIVFDSVGVGFKPAPAQRHGLSEIMRAFKTFSSRRINETRKTPGAKVWQRGFWERIIRNEEELNGIREYIQNNPLQWTLDRLHPQSGWIPRVTGAGLKPAPTDGWGAA